MTPAGKPEKIIIALDNRDYLWTGKSWVDAKRFIIPERVVCQKLDQLAAERFSEEDEQVDEPIQLTQLARAAREAKQYARAERLARRVLGKDPNDTPALSILCSVLRDSGKPEMVLALTKAHINGPGVSTAILTTRAAACCDLEMWEEALRLAKRAFAISSQSHADTGYAGSVMNRIQKFRPDLFPKDRTR